jgi:hypothetical protein
MGYGVGGPLVVERNCEATFEVANSRVAAFTLRMLYTCPRLYKGPPVAAWYRDANSDDLQMSVEMVEPRAAYQLGV